MEFNEKLQELRKQKGLTQEELARALYVSRAAVSKWESGRGYPNIDSLKAMARFFSVTVDRLLSGEEILTLANEENRHSKEKMYSTVLGLLDISAVMILFFPIFAQRNVAGIASVSLLSLTAIQPYIRIMYMAVIVFTVIAGAFNLVSPGRKNLTLASFLLSGVGIVLFTLTLQPYPAVFWFSFLMIKLILIVKTGGNGKYH